MPAIEMVAGHTEVPHHGTRVLPKETSFRCDQARISQESLICHQAHSSALGSFHWQEILAIWSFQSVRSQIFRMILLSAVYRSCRKLLLCQHTLLASYLQIRIKFFSPVFPEPDPSRHSTEEIPEKFPYRGCTHLISPQKGITT